MDGFVEHVVEEVGRSNLQDEKMEVMPINILTRMNVVLTVLEAASTKMMRMDIRLIVSMVDKLIKLTRMVNKLTRMVDKLTRMLDLL